MEGVKELLKNNKPFLIIKYEESMRGLPDTRVIKYELIRITKCGKYTVGRILDSKVKGLLLELKKFTTHYIENESGEIYEFFNFKKELKTKKLKIKNDDNY